MIVAPSFCSHAERVYSRVTVTHGSITSGPMRSEASSQARSPPVGRPAAMRLRPRPAAPKVRRTSQPSGVGQASRARATSSVPATCFAKLDLASGSRKRAAKSRAFTARNTSRAGASTGRAPAARSCASARGVGLQAMPTSPRARSASLPPAASISSLTTTSSGPTSGPRSRRLSRATSAFRCSVGA